MYCSVCGRKLRSPSSIKAGCGPVCYQKLYGITLKQYGNSGKKVDIQQEGVCYDIPGQINLEDYLQELEGK
jgi:hypothetical protein